MWEHEHLLTNFESNSYPFAVKFCDCADSKLLMFHPDAYRDARCIHARLFRFPRFSSLDGFAAVK